MHSNFENNRKKKFRENGNLILLEYSEKSFFFYFIFTSNIQSVSLIQEKYMLKVHSQENNLIKGATH